MMVAEVKKNPEPVVDPLHGCSIISLLPRTNKDFDKPTIISEQQQQQQQQQNDMEFIQTYLKSVTIECSDKHLKQAKAILSSTSELQKSEFPCPVLSADKKKLIPEKGKDRPQERPGLGRKRAQFSFKPNTSQPALDENLNLNSDHLQDPEEFFAAFEKLENAKNELKKQRGDISTDILTHNTSTTIRNRRPGILGKTAVYKHRHSSVFVDSEETILSSQENFETDVPSQIDNSLIVEMADQHAESKEKELASHGHIDVSQRKDSLAEEGKRLNSLLDEMLSTNCTDLDEDGAVIFLQDRLQIKPFNFEKLSLPKFDSVRRSDLKASAEHLGRPRKALSDIHNKLRRVNSKTTTECRQVLESSMFPLGSQNPPKSPYSAMAVLKKRISQMEPPVNTFSFSGTDTSPARDCSQVEGIEKLDVSPNTDYDPSVANDTTYAEDNDKKLNFAGHFQSLLFKEDNPAGSNMVSKKLLTEISACLHDMPMDDGSNLKNAGMNIRSSGSDSDKHEVPPHSDYVHNNACNSDTTSGKLNEKKLSLSQRLQSPVLQEDNIAYSNMVSGKLVTEILASPDITMDDSSNRVITEMDITLSGSDGNKNRVSPNGDNDHNVQSPMLEEDKTAGSNMLSKKLVTETSASPPGMPSIGNSNRANSDIGIRSSGSNGVLEDSVKDTREEAVAPEQPKLDFEGLPEENMDYGSHLDQFDIIAGEHLPKDGYSKSQDIFSERNNETHQEPSGISMIERNNQKTPPHNQRKRNSISKRKSLSGKLVTENLASPSEMSMNESSSRLTTDMDIRSNGSDDVEDQTRQEPSGISKHEQNNQKTHPHNRRKRKCTSKRKNLSGKPVTENLASRSEMSMNENSSRLNTEMDIRSNGSDDVEEQTHQESAKTPMNEKIEQESSSHNQRKRKGSTSKLKGLSGKLVMKSSSCLPEKSMDENSNRSNTDMDIRSSVSDAVLDQTHQKSSIVSMNERSKQEGPPHKQRKRREISNRKSLAGAGTVFDAESGRRKSLRYKTKPLEFWKGERFLLGRVHETLVTVIGVRRYESPASAKGKGKKRKLPTFKAESLVSEEFKDLVERAALH